jgi:hypothetical protein
MDLVDVVKEKRKLKQLILITCSEHISDFKNKTGIDVKYCKLEFIESRSIGTEDSEFLISDVELYLNI